MKATEQDNIDLLKASEEGDLERIKELLDLDGININVRNEHNNQPIHLAAIGGHIDIIALFLNKGVRIDEQNQNGDTALHFAASCGHQNLIEFLLDNGANIEAEDKRILTPLHIAILKGRIKTAEFLISKGADIEAENKDSFTPLHIAILKGRIKTTEFIITKGANIEAKNKHSFTPLHVAIIKGRLKIAELLISKGANIMAKDKYDRLPIHLAVLYHQTKIVKLLLDHGVDVNKVSIDHTTILNIAVLEGDVRTVELLLAHGADKEAKDKGIVGTYYLDRMRKKGYTALSLAAGRGLLKITKLLLAHGANIDAKGNDGNFPLSLAIMQGKLKIVKLLLEHGANIEEKNKDGDTPLSLAAGKGNLEIVKLLLTQGAKINSFAAYLFSRKTALNEALIQKQIEIANFLLKEGADIEAKDHNGDTALQVSLNRNNLEMAKKLLKRDAKVNVKNKDGYTPLHSAIYTKSSRIISLLLKRGAKVNVKNKRGETPLHKAASCGYTEITRMLIDARADINVIDDYEHTPLYNAMLSSKGEEVLKLLLKNGADIDIKDKNGETLIYLFLERYRIHERIDIGKLKILLENGAKINIQNRWGKAPIHIATTDGNTLALCLLIIAGADLNILDNMGRTALDIATVQNIKDILTDIDPVSAAKAALPALYGKELLDASFERDLKKVKGLLEIEEIDVSIKDRKGYNALEIAALKSNLLICSLLMLSGKYTSVDIANAVKLVSQKEAKKLEALKFEQSEQIKNPTETEYKKYKKIREFLEGGKEAAILYMIEYNNKNAKKYSLQLRDIALVEKNFLSNIMIDTPNGHEELPTDVISKIVGYVIEDETFLTQDPKARMKIENELFQKHLSVKREDIKDIVYKDIEEEDQNDSDQNLICKPDPVKQSYAKVLGILAFISLCIMAIPLSVPTLFGAVTLVLTIISGIVAAALTISAICLYAEGNKNISPLARNLVQEEQIDKPVNFAGLESLEKESNQLSMV